MVVFPRQLQPASSRSSPRVVFIGIARPSGVGKSTLAGKMAIKFKSPCLPVSLDWFTCPRRMPQYPNGDRNWETPEGNFTRVTKSLRRLLALCREPLLPEQQDLGFRILNVVRPGYGGTIPASIIYVVVEGFLLFHSVAVCWMLDTRIWLGASPTSCMARRRRRGKIRSGSNQYRAFETM